VFGVHRSTYYRWRAAVDRHGLEMLRPRERRLPPMPNQVPQHVERRVVAFSLAHPGYARIASAPSWHDRNGARYRSALTASGVCLVAMVSTRAASATR
jgi:hypothetical protein